MERKQGVTRSRTSMIITIRIKGNNTWTNAVHLNWLSAVGSAVPSTQGLIITSWNYNGCILIKLHCIYLNKGMINSKQQRKKTPSLTWEIEQTYLTIMATKFSNYTSRSNVPVKDLPISTTGTQLRVIPVVIRKN